MQILNQKMFDGFPWQGDEKSKAFQVKAVLAYEQWLRRFSKAEIDADVAWELVKLCAFIAQKQHDAGEWWAEALGEQVKMLQNDISQLQLKLSLVEDRLCEATAEPLPSPLPPPLALP